MLSKLKKKFSQNFLIDKNIKKKILNFLKISKSDIFLEIGPGDAFLSNDISSVRKLILVEIDTSLISFLKKKFYYKTNVLVLNDDILKFNFKDFFLKFNSVRIFGNIPYHISSQILFLFIDFHKFVIDIHITLQLDLAKKIVSNYKYSYLSFILKFYFDVNILFNINPLSFSPKPKVSSAFLVLYPKQVNYIINIDFFNNITKFFFLNKKKKIIKNFLMFKLMYKFFKLDSKIYEINYNEYLRLVNFLYVCKFFKFKLID